MGASDSLHQILMKRSVGLFGVCIINDDIGRVGLSEGHRLWTGHGVETLCWNYAYAYCIFMNLFQFTIDQGTQ